MLSVFNSLKALHPDSMEDPVLSITFPPSTRRIDRKTNFDGVGGPISNLDAGDAHFSFIVTHFWEPEPGVEYYHNIWSVRTDSRSMDDDAWILLEDEFSIMEDPSFVTVKVSDRGKEMVIMCANGDELVDFVECVSNGWITAAVSDDNRAWIFPFGRAISTIPDLPVGEVKELKDAFKVSVGDQHIVVVTGTSDHPCFWTFGLNDHGQRGFVNDGQNPQPTWRKLDLMMDVTLRDLTCGKWNTYLVSERKISNSI